MISRAQARRDRRKLLRELKQAERDRYRETVKTLRIEERAAKLRRREGLRKARELCKANAQAAREVAELAYKRARELALEARRATKAAAAEGCALGKAYVRSEADAKIAHARARRTEEQRFRDEMKRLEADARARDKSRASKAERRDESSGAVEANISPELVPLWRKVKRSIKGTERMSRTEAFLHYVEEHPHEVHAVQEKSDREYARDQRRAYQQAARAAVPF